MFLIHGIRRKELRGELLQGLCPKCADQGTMQLLVVQPYVHLFWLPLFPLPKRGRWKCMHCGHEVKQGQMPEHAREILPLLKQEARTPWWTFTGSVLLAVPLVFFVQAIADHGKEQDSLLQEPNVGDVWTIKLGHKHYTLYRVEEVRTDSVFVRKSAHEVEGAGILALSKFQLANADDFTGDRMGYARKELLELEAHGPIYSMERKHAESGAR